MQLNTDLAEPLQGCVAVFDAGSQKQPEIVDWVY